MEQTNIGDDYSVDPVLEEACHEVVRSGCPNERSGERRLVPVKTGCYSHLAYVCV